MLCNFTRRHRSKMNYVRGKFSFEHKHNNRVPDHVGQTIVFRGLPPEMADDRKWGRPSFFVVCLAKMADDKKWGRPSFFVVCLPKMADDKKWSRPSFFVVCVRRWQTTKNDRLPHFITMSYRDWLRRAFLPEPVLPLRRFSDAPPALPW